MFLEAIQADLETLGSAGHDQKLATVDSTSGFDQLRSTCMIFGFEPVVVYTVLTPTLGRRITRWLPR
jgi:hypothetical protein